jgi:transposase
MTFTPIGIDIAKATFDAAALCHGKCKTKVFRNTPEGFTAFLAWLQAFPSPPCAWRPRAAMGKPWRCFYPITASRSV